MKSVRSIIDFQELAGSGCERVDTAGDLGKTFSLISPLFSDTQESEKEGSSRCRKTQTGHYFFISKCL